MSPRIKPPAEMLADALLGQRIRQEPDARCTECGRIAPLNVADTSEPIPHCSGCGRVVYLCTCARSTR